jgi:hypothetical protein
MKAYAYDKNKTELYELITLLKKRRDGCIGEPIKRAPRRECLKMFGGTVSIDEFRRNKTPITLTIPGEYFQAPIVSNSLFNDFNVVKQSCDDDDLKLKRSKPLSRAKGKLETLLKKCSDAAKPEK